MATPYNLLGNEELLTQNTFTFLCSHKVPDSVFNAIRQWIDSLNPQTDCVICGCLSGVERYALKYLVHKRMPIILALAESIPDDIGELSMRLKDIVLSESMGNKRLLIASCISDTSINSPSGKTAELRNKMMISLGKHIVVGYAMPMGNLARQLIIHKNTTYLVSSDTQLSSRSVNDEQTSKSSPEENMGWGIYEALKENYSSLGSLETRKLLFQYLNLGINRPSLLHSSILLLVIKNFDVYPDLKFAAFLRMWGVNNFRNEDWKAHKVNGHWIPSLAERAISKLFKWRQGETSNCLDKELIRYMIARGKEINPKNQKYNEYEEKLSKIENWNKK